MSLKSAAGVRIPKGAEIVAHNIRREIVTGKIAPGQGLPPEARLMEIFNLSRPTIREALRILEFEGLITVARGAHGGAKVAEPSNALATRAIGITLQARGTTLGDVYRARAILEPAAARLAAETRPIEAAAALRSHIELELGALEREPVIPVLIAEFHSLLMEQCGNSTLAVIAATLRDLVAQHQIMAHKATPKNPALARKQSLFGVRSHQKLADLIRSGDGAGAEAHWQIHMQRAGDFYLPELAHKSVIDMFETAADDFGRVQMS